MWQGNAGPRKKNSLVNWDLVCYPKEFGGLGVKDLHLMNVSLLIKWWWKWTNPMYSGLWKQLLQRKYNSHTPLTNMSCFWREVTKLRYIGRLSCTFQIGNGQTVKFWTDTWYSECPLSTIYPHLFELCSNPFVCVQEVIESRGTMLRFRRNLHGILLSEWHTIVAIVNSCSLNNSPDCPKWKWDSKLQFSTASLYRFLSFRGVQVSFAEMWWHVPVPLKIQIFMWLLFRNKILTKDVLSQKKWQGDMHCLFCNCAIESTLHLFLKCPYIAQIWFWMGQFQNFYGDWTSLENIQSLAQSLPLKQREAMLMVVSAICWGVWKTRNAVCFDNKPVPTIRQLLLLICSLLDYWTGTKKRYVMQFVQSWTPEDLDMVPLQTLPPLLALEMPYGSSETLVPTMMVT